MMSANAPAQRLRPPPPHFLKMQDPHLQFLSLGHTKVIVQLNGLAVYFSMEGFGHDAVPFSRRLEWAAMPRQRENENHGAHAPRSPRLCSMFPFP